MENGRPYRYRYSGIERPIWGFILPEIILTLRGQNATVYSGYYNSGEKRVRVGIDGDFNGIEDIRNLLIRGHEEDDIRLGDVADITKGYVQPQQEGLKYDTLPAIAISVAMQKGGNIIQLGKVIDQKLDELKQNIIPAGINFEKVFFQPTRVKDAISVFMVNLIESVLIVIIVVMLAMGFRSGYIIGNRIGGSCFGFFCDFTYDARHFTKGIPGIVYCSYGNAGR